MAIRTTAVPLTGTPAAADRRPALLPLSRGSLAGLTRKAAQALRARWQLRRCASVGARALVEGRVIVNCEGDGAIHIGERVRFRGSHVPIELGALPGAELVLGAETFVNSGVSICAQERVEIGARCAIGNYTLIMDGDFHDVDDHRQPGLSAPIVLEDDVWLGARVTVLKGVRIGRGAVVAAGAVVTRDVPPRTLVAGVPARIVRALGGDSAEARREGKPE